MKTQLLSSFFALLLLTDFPGDTAETENPADNKETAIGQFDSIISDSPVQMQCKRPAEINKQENNQAEKKEIDPAVIEKLAQLQDSIDQTTEEITKLLAAVPIKPARKLKSHHAFCVRFDPSDPKMADLCGYESLIFAWDEARSPYDSTLYAVKWYSVKLTRGNEVDDYYLELLANDRTEKLYVFPVFEEKAFGKAMRVFEKKLAAHQEKIKQLERKKAGFMLAYDALRISWEKELNEFYDTVDKKGRRF